MAISISGGYYPSTHQNDFLTKPINLIDQLIDQKCCILTSWTWVTSMEIHGFLLMAINGNQRFICLENQLPCRMAVLEPPGEPVTGTPYSKEKTSIDRKITKISLYQFRLDKQLNNILENQTLENW